MCGEGKQGGGGMWRRCNKTRWCSDCGEGQDGGRKRRRVVEGVGGGGVARQSGEENVEEENKVVEGVWRRCRKCGG